MNSTSYFLDPENAAEMARLRLQGEMVTSHLGGYFPLLTQQECEQLTNSTGDR